MSGVQPAEQLERVLPALGARFLGYVLARDDDVDPLAGQFSDAQQEVVAVLAALVSSIEPGDAAPLLLGGRLGALVPGQNHSLPNLLRLSCDGALPSVAKTEDPVVDALAPLMIEAYPLLLLPRGRFNNMPAALGSLTYQHPSRQQFENAVLADPALTQLFPDDSDPAGRSGSTIRSSGANDLQLTMFAHQQITVAYDWATLDSEAVSVSGLAERMTQSIRTIRAAIEHEAVTVPVRVGLAGFLLPPEQPELRLGSVSLRIATESDRSRLGSGEVSDELQMTEPDGTTIRINFSGNIVASFELRYEVRIGSLETGLAVMPREWTTAQSLIEEKIENVRLALALAYGADQPASVVRSWQRILDPLGFGASLSWSDLRTAPNFHPRTLTAEEASSWAEWSQRVENGRSPQIAVAIRRMLQALAERADPSDLMVDAVIVWENLFGAKQETKLRITAALAWLLGRDAADRDAKRRRYGKLYDARSDIVHGSATMNTATIGEQSREAVGISLEALRTLFRDRPELLAERESAARSMRLLMDQRRPRSASPKPEPTGVI